LALDLLSKMLIFIPQKRTSAIEALNHPYFQEYGLVPSPGESDMLPHTDLTSTFSDLSDNETLIEEDADKGDESEDKDKSKEL
jgi:serine/threonine protein kinase